MEEFEFSPINFAVKTSFDHYNSNMALVLLNVSVMTQAYRQSKPRAIYLNYWWSAYTAQS